MTRFVVGLLGAMGAVVLFAGCAILGGGVSVGGVSVSVNTKKQLVMGRGKWAGPADCSAVATLRKTSDALIVSINVKDDCISKSGGEPYENDSVELYFDVRPGKSRGRSYYSTGAFQVVVELPEKDGEAKIHWYQGNGEDSYAAVPDAKAVYAKTADGYNVTVTLPLEGIKKAHGPLGHTFNFAFGVNDVDKDGVRSQIMSSGTSENYCDPSGLVTVAL